MSEQGIKLGTLLEVNPELKEEKEYVLMTKEGGTVNGVDLIHMAGMVAATFHQVMVQSKASEFHIKNANKLFKNAIDIATKDAINDLKNNPENDKEEKLHDALKEVFKVLAED